MFFKKSCTQIFMSWYLFFPMPYKQWLYKCHKVHEDYTEHAENTKSAERQKISFPKE